MASARLAWGGASVHKQGSGLGLFLPALPWQAVTLDLSFSWFGPG